MALDLLARLFYQHCLERPKKELHLVIAFVFSFSNSPPPVIYLKPLSLYH